jgi:hypothetical protein
MLRPFLRSPVAPWSGIIAGPVAWLLMHQGLGDSLYFDCKVGNPLAAIVFGVISLAILAGAGWLSWLGRRSPEAEGPEPQARFFLSMIGLLLCGLFAVVVLLQLMAGLILPGCYR